MDNRRVPLFSHWIVRAVYVVLLSMIAGVGNFAALARNTMIVSRGTGS